MSDTPKPKTPIRLTFPKVLQSVVEAAMLPEADKAWVEEEIRRHNARLISQNGFKELKLFVQHKKRYPNLRSELDKRIWEEPLQKSKTNINTDPEVAVSVYSNWNQGWSIAEITEIACKNPRAAYQLALKCPDANTEALQRSITTNAQISYYFAKDVPNASTTLANLQTAASPYWRYRLTVDILDSSDDALRYLRTQIAYEPEAASTWLRLHKLECAELECCLRCLQRSPEWSYLTALGELKDWKPRMGDEGEAEIPCAFWKDLRATALTHPQWAYHWWHYIEPENLIENLETFGYHPGWLAQTLEDCFEDDDKRKTDAIIQATNLIQHTFDDEDIYFSSFLLWGADVAHRSGHLSPPEETAQPSAAENQGAESGEEDPDS